MQELTIFQSAEFGSIRTSEQGGKVLFCGTDVAVALGYANPRKAVRDHTKGGTKCSTPTSSGEQSMTFVPEGDVYRLIAHSKLPSAERFERWVFDEVLPSIRQTGEYKTPDRTMSDYQKMMMETREQNVHIQKARLLNQIAAGYDGAYKQVLQAHATKELTGEFLLPLPKLEEKTYSATEIGEILGISSQKVGALANRHNLKSAEFGAWFHDKAKGSNKEVQSFRYFESVIPVLRSILEQPT